MYFITIGLKLWLKNTTEIVSPKLMTLYGLLLIMILSINHRICNKQLSNYALNQAPRHSNLVVVNIKKYIKNVGSDEIKLID